MSCATKGKGRFQRRHYIILARIIREADLDRDARLSLFNKACDILTEDNTLFQEGLFHSEVYDVPMV